MGRRIGLQIGCLVFIVIRLAPAQLWAEEKSLVAEIAELAVVGRLVDLSVDRPWLPWKNGFTVRGTIIVEEVLYSRGGLHDDLDGGVRIKYEYGCETCPRLNVEDASHITERGIWFLVPLRSGTWSAASTFDGAPGWRSIRDLDYYTRVLTQRAAQNRDK